MGLKKYLVVILFFISGQAMACPPGQQPAGNPTAGNPSGCVPYPGPSTQPSRPVGRWENRWGAVAIDNTVSPSSFGAVKNVKSKKEATKSAIKLCKQNGGGKGCKIDVAYYNQCAVVTWGSTGYSTASGPDINETSQRSMERCNANYKNCKTYYAECSEPVWMQ
jgi:hypothetical protein